MASPSSSPTATSTGDKDDSYSASKCSSSVSSLFFVSFSIASLFRFQIKRYLQEIGYTDTIIDVRSNRVRSLLGLNPAGNASDKDEQGGGGGVGGGGGNINGGSGGGGGSVGGSGGTGSSPGDPSGNSKRLSESQGRRAPAKKVPPASLAEAMIMDTEASVMANFDFLAQEGVGVEVDDEDDMSDEMEDNTDDDADDATVSNAATSKRSKMKNKVR